MQPIKFAGKSRLFILAVISLSTAMASCDVGMEEHTLVRDQYYVIDPSTIVNEISQHPQNAFIPVDAEPQTIPLTQRTSVNWLQKDYLQIAGALFKVIWGEPYDDWGLKYMIFRLSCDDVERGFQQASFSFFKVKQIRERPSRFERSVSINLSNDSVNVLEYEYYPIVSDWPSTKWSQIKISANEALRIAETNGGKEKRLEVENKCDIVVTLSPGSASFDGWLVSYTQSGTTNLFHLDIDPSTGNYK